MIGSDYGCFYCGSVNYESSSSSSDSTDSGYQDSQAPSDHQAPTEEQWALSSDEDEGPVSMIVNVDRGYQDPVVLTNLAEEVD